MDIRGAVDAAVPTNIIAAKAAEVRANKVNWQSYLQGQMISGEDCEFIKKFEVAHSEQKQAILTNEGHQCAKTFLNLMAHISKEQTVQYILTLIDDTLQENHQRVNIFFDYAKKTKNTAWSYFLPMLNRQDLFTVHMAARIIAKLAAWGRDLMEGSDLNYYFNWIKTQLSSQKLHGTGAETGTGTISPSESSQYVQCVAGCLQLMLRVNEYRFAWVEADGVNCITAVLSNKCGFQLQYQMIFCVWLLAFSPQLCEQLRRYNVVPALSDILQESVKEKVTRIILAAFRPFRGGLAGVFWIIVLLQNPSLLQLEVTNLPIYQSGKGYKAISKALGLPRTTVRAIIYKWRKHGTVENLLRSGRPTKITPRAQRQLIQEVTKDPTTTSKEMQASLASVKNLLEKSAERETRQEYALAMIQCKVLKQLENLDQQKYDDEDITDDIKFLLERLGESVQDLSSFDEYSSELKSGRLEWSPVHKSEKFWRENAVRLNEKNYELLKILTRLLEMSDDPQVIAVAAHDVGEYVRHYPRGKRVIEQLGGKQLVMNHMHHEDQLVRYNALLAVQKLMVHNWEYLGKQLQSTEQSTPAVAARS
ncbi:hypothetical protein QTP70_025682 [Hemibagrus guttatus]|uniref:V-type proton ATPase subunit H n=2 Tax=Otophysi TaxID=186626 RepID=A0AAE0VAR1_9TELE|nr:hypothetical protein QTP70_025682 [Hemibagrus guttatus]KAK3567498.1 hypothetical protein QTP86_019955 [Hemibagrus guttatus]